MATVVVLLRAVNLGTHNRLPMARLREILTDLGAREVRTHLASGQAVVRVDATAVGGLADTVHDALAQHLHLDIAVLTRTPAELAAVIADNPYPQLVDTPKRLHVVFLDATPDPALVDRVGRRHDPDEFTVGDRVLYLAYAGTSRDSPLGAVLRRLGGVQTARNWTTVTALATLAGGG